MILVSKRSDREACSPGKLSSAQRWQYVKQNCYKWKHKWKRYLEHLTNVNKEKSNYTENNSTGKMERKTI